MNGLQLELNGGETLDEEDKPDDEECRVEDDRREEEGTALLEDDGMTIEIPFALLLEMPTVAQEENWILLEEDSSGLLLAGSPEQAWKHATLMAKTRSFGFIFPCMLKEQTMIYQSTHLI